MRSHHSKLQQCHFQGAVLTELVYYSKTRLHLDMPETLYAILVHVKWKGSLSIMFVMLQL